MKNIKIEIYGKKQSTKDGKRRFVSYKTKMLLKVRLTEEMLAKNPKLVGEVGDVVKLRRNVDVKFGKGVPSAVLSKIVGKCVLTCQSDKVSAPHRYEVRKVVDEKTGEARDAYPYVYISDIVDVERVQDDAKQEDFVLSDDSDSESSDVTL